MSDDEKQDEVNGEPADGGHDAAEAAGSGMSGVRAAMNVIADRGLDGVLGEHAALIGEDMTSRLSIAGATAVSRRFDITKLAGLESISERVSTAAAAAAFKLDDAMNAIAGPSLSSILGTGRSAADLIGRYPGLDATKGFDFTKLAGMSADLTSISERVSAAAKSWMASSSEAHGALAASVAFKFDGIDPMRGVQAAINAMAGPSLSDVLGSGRSAADLLGRYPGLDATKGYDFTRLAGVDPHGVNSGLAAAVLKVHDGVGRLSSAQAAMNALASPRISGMLGGDHGARFGMDWARSELGRDSHGLTGLLGAGGAMADHLSIFDKVMGDSQQAMREAMGQWSSSMPSTAWMTEAMRGPAESIAAMMRGWSILADGGHWAARLALRMALAAKRAVMHGDIDAVKRFLCD